MTAACLRVLIDNIFSYLPLRISGEVNGSIRVYNDGTDGDLFAVAALLACCYRPIHTDPDVFVSCFLLVEPTPNIFFSGVVSENCVELDDD